MKTLAALFLSLLTSTVLVAGEFTPTTEPISPNGVRAAIDLPGYLHQRNSGGTDGTGLCVFTSGEVAGWKWQGLEALEGFQKWMEGHPGGGWPDKFDAMLKEYCDERGIEVPAYIQHVGGDEEFLALALRTRRAPCITYAGMDDFYDGPIAHMVVLGNLGVSDSCILDNNRPGKWLWMSREDLVYRWKYNTVGKGWAYVFLAPPPPPGVDEVKPGPKPTPKPKPKPKRPWKPLFPRWHKVELGSGETLWKLYNNDVFLGVWAKDGWHEAVQGIQGEGWTPEPSGYPPLPKPDIEALDLYWGNDGNLLDRESIRDYFENDEEKPFVTVVVKDAKAKTDLKKLLSGDPVVTKALSSVHLNIYTKDFWAAGRVKHVVTAQKNFGAHDIAPVWFNDGAPSVATISEAIKRVVGPRVPDVAPVPREKQEVPSVPSESPTSPEENTVPLSPVTVPLWAFWGTVGATILGAYYVRSR